MELTLKLTEKNDVDFTILPVIHTVSDDLDLLKYGLNKIEDILGESPELIGIGSLVPLVKTMKGSKKNGIESFIYALITLRKMLPNSFIHAFFLLSDPIGPCIARMYCPWTICLFQCFFSLS